VTDSRNKGRSAEREVELAFQRRGVPTDRNLSGRKQVAGDIATSGLAVEVRRRERIDIARWCADHEAETPEHLTPIVVWRKSREPWRVSLTLDDFLDLLGEARA